MAPASRGRAVTFPGSSFAPTQVRVALEGTAVVDGETSGSQAKVKAVAEAYPLAPTASTEMASGGGYSGPLAMRQGEGMRPDVAEAFDAMAAAARQDGHALLINSAFRSDAEQAALFAANPDPRMVARPGTSLHRCGTELDLGPPSAYGWLARTPSASGSFSATPGRRGTTATRRVPRRARRQATRWARQSAEATARKLAAGAALLRPGASSATPSRGAASRWNVPGNVLAAQLLAESNFNPLAVSPAGASGIAQFMPGTAAAYGLERSLRPR